MEKERLFEVLEALGFSKVLPGENGWTEKDFTECCYIFDGELWIFFGGKGRHFWEENTLEISPSTSNFSSKYMDYHSELNGDILTVKEFLVFWKKFYIGYIMDNIDVNINLKNVV